MISIDKITPTGYRYHFPTIDFKFQNTGDATTFLWKFTVSVLHAEIDVTPILDFSSEVREGVLQVGVTNNGWGTAHDFQLQIEESTLNRVFAESTRQYRESIQSGESRTILCWSRNLAIPRQFEAVRKEFITIEHEGFHSDCKDWWSWFRSNRVSTHGMRIGPLLAKWQCKDEKGREHKNEEDIAMSRSFKDIVLTSDGFIEIEKSVPFSSFFTMYLSDMTFIVMIDLLKNHEKTYAISRKIPPGDIERFHIMVGSPMSCHLRVNFKFFADKNNIIESEGFDIYIWNPRNSGWHRYYKDGEDLERMSNTLQQIARRRLLWIKKI